VLKKLALLCVAVTVALAFSAPVGAASNQDLKDLKKKVEVNITLLEKENETFYEILRFLQDLVQDPNANCEDVRRALHGYFMAHGRKTLTTIQAVGSLLDFQRALVEDWENISPKEFKSFISWGSKRNEKTQEEVRSLTEKQNLAIEKAIAIALKDLTPAASPVTTTP